MQKLFPLRTQGIVTNQPHNVDVAADGQKFLVNTIVGGSDLVVLEGRRPDVEPGAYLVSAGTRAVRKLFTYAAQSPQPELAISPDGQQLLYLVWDAVPPSLRTLDLTPAVRR